MNKTKEEVSKIALDFANEVYSRCMDFVIGVENTGISLVDYDINGAIDSRLINSSIDGDETLRDGMYEILEDINSLEFEMYEKEDIDIYTGMYDCIVDIMVKKFRNDGYSVYVKMPDYDCDLEYSIGEVLPDGVYNVADDSGVLSAFIVTLPYDLVVVKM